jgi:hypothetical protein
MASNRLNDPLAASALRAYERARWKQALVGFSPALVVPVMVLCIDGMALRTVALGLGLFSVGVIVLWRGQEAARGVLPGFLAGLVPLAAALCAPRMHLCTGGICMSVCLAACFGGGLVAGIVVGLAWRFSQRGLIALSVAAVISTITGAIGCACLGYGGVAGMAAGLALGMLPWAAHPLRH